MIVVAITRQCAALAAGDRSADRVLVRHRCPGMRRTGWPRRGGMELRRPRHRGLDRLSYSTRVQMYCASYSSLVVTNFSERRRRTSRQRIELRENRSSRSLETRRLRDRDDGAGTGTHRTMVPLAAHRMGK